MTCQATQSFSLEKQQKKKKKRKEMQMCFLSAAHKMLLSSNSLCHYFLSHF